MHTCIPASKQLSFSKIQSGSVHAWTTSKKKIFMRTREYFSVCRLKKKVFIFSEGNIKKAYLSPNFFLVFNKREKESPWTQNSSRRLWGCNALIRCTLPPFPLAGVTFSHFVFQTNIFSFSVWLSHQPPASLTLAIAPKPFSSWQNAR